MTKEKLIELLKVTPEQANKILENQKLMDNLDEANSRREQKLKEKEENEFVLYDNEVAFLRSIEDTKIKSIFYALICYEKLHGHSSGWTKLDIIELKKLCNFTNYGLADFSLLKDFGLSLKVSGKKKPIPTFGSICDIIGRDFPYKNYEVLYEISEMTANEKFAEIVGA